MQCTVFKSTVRDFTYVYLRDDLEFEDLPGELRTLFGEPARLMALDLSARDQLGQENIQTVRQNLESDGFHLQLPPSEDPSGWLELPRPKEPDHD